MLRKITWVLFFLLGVTAVHLIGGAVQASPALNIGLTRFEGIPLDNAIRLEWDTDTELGTAGFKLKRGQNGSFAFLADPSGGGDLFIDNIGGPSQGSQYGFTDETAANGETYTYQLIEILADGGEIFQADVTLKAGVEPTDTPVVVGGGPPGSGGGGGGGGGSTQATATMTLTPTTTSSPTQTPAASNTPLPSATAQATATVASSPTAANAAVPGVDDDDPTVGFSTPAAPDPEPTVSTSDADVDDESDSNGDSGIPIAVAQEEIVDESSGAGLESGVAGSAGQPTEQASGDTAVDSVERPLVIGQRNLSNGSGQQVFTTQEGDGETQPSSIGGRVFLWLAFLAAVVIFVAAVIGAILLYTRRRNKA